MVVLLRAAALNLSTATLRHLRCGGRSSRRVLVAAMLTSAVAMLFAFTVRYPFANWFAVPSTTVSSFETAASLSPTADLRPPPVAPVLPPKPTVYTTSAPPSLALPTVLPPPPPPPPLLLPSPDLAISTSPLPFLATSPPLPAGNTNPPFSFLAPPPPPPPPTVNSDSKEVKSSGGEAVPSPQSETPLWLTARDRELMYAKREISRAPLVVDDQELYAPLFRNVSIFKRSYELMERMLKVYIYKDGPRPIFHQPDLKGIYASEGWFMKLMEQNKKFVAKDPSKAHLFYLPYGARQLEIALYVPDSHDMKPLLIYMKNYVNMISAKYPFWNRTRGADHFLVACHDWGPQTTRMHDELHRNTIKALCNADVSDGIFVRGKDVSLPETNIRTPKRPLRDIGGKPVSQRSILAFFAGNMHGSVRPILLKYWEGKDEDMKIYGPLPSKIGKKMSYIQHMKSSKFCICPKGYEVNSPRIVEAIYYECVPVIIADNFVLPFDEVLNWSAFSLIIEEKDIPNLKNTLLEISPRQYISMQMNVKRLQKHFMWHSRPVKYDIFYMILHSIWFNRLNQIQVPL